MEWESVDDNRRQVERCRARSCGSVMLRPWQPMVSNPYLGMQCSRAKAASTLSSLQQEPYGTGKQQSPYCSVVALLLG